MLGPLSRFAMTFASIRFRSSSSATAAAMAMESWGRRTTLWKIMAPCSVFPIFWVLFPPSIGGATHHALEDYGSLLCFPNLRAYIPAFDGDVAAIVPQLFTIEHPAYFRLG